MTNELAIQEMLTVASHLKQTSQGEAVMMGAVALEKQMPKKPSFTEGNPYFNFYLKKNILNYWCPNCECEVDEDRDSWCPSCGQRLEWE